MQSIWENETDPKKREIVKAALEEFAVKRYELASTNRVIQQAGVSKGLLFHHFGNKKQLFLSIADQCIEYFFWYIKQASASFSRDPLERLRDLHTAKMNLFVQQPYIYQLSVYAFVERCKEIQADIQAIEDQFQQRYLALYLENLDVGQIRETIPREQALRLLLESVEAITRNIVQKHKFSADKGLAFLGTLNNELDALIGLVKHGLYKVD
ncbi:TetR/AcrR family transcriptional regulator [Paenibacillus senegalensis]|uniref:TetR/AcrR family transcriptional regulator n=1 Tax=Paenibacillus senegalensis TaxID=1465766 RepID=UPI000288AABE|nr:TetR/AcrR family transcriptional regulator [Paenibacillus senegalensis]